MKKAMPFFIFYNIIGVGFIGIFLFFILNSAFSSDEIYQEHYEVIGTDPDYKIFGHGSVVYLLENETFQSDAYLRSSPFIYYLKLKETPIMEYDFRRGLFGYRIKVDNRLVKEKPSE